MLKHRYPRSTGAPPMRGSILDDESNLMHYRGGCDSASLISSSYNRRELNDYEGVESVISEEDTLQKSSSTSSSSSQLHCYDEVDDALFNDDVQRSSPYCVVGHMEDVPPSRNRRFGSTASSMSQDSGAFCYDEGPPHLPPPPPLPRKPSQRRSLYVNISSSSPPPLPPRKNHRTFAPPPPLPCRPKTPPSPLHMNINLPGLNPVGRKDLLLSRSEEPSKKSKRRVTLHNFEQQESGMNKGNSSPSSSSHLPTKKKFKIFGSKTPLCIPSTHISSSPRRKKIFRRSLINTSLRKKKVLDPGLSTPISNSSRRRSMFGISSSSSSKEEIIEKKCSDEPLIKSEEIIIQSSKDEDFSHCIRDAMSQGLPIIPFQSSDNPSEASLRPETPGPCCCRSSLCHEPPIPPRDNHRRSLDNILGEAKREMEDEEKRLLHIMMKHADLLLTPKMIRAALKKNPSIASASSESDLSEEELSEYLEMHRLPSDGSSNPSTHQRRRHS